jgi:hypothetical protein
MPSFDPGGSHQTISGPDIWAAFDHKDKNRAYWTFQLLNWLSQPTQDARWNMGLGNAAVQKQRRAQMNMARADQLRAGAGMPAEAGNWFKCKKTADCPEEECLEDGSVGNQNCPKQRRRCQWCHGRGCQYCSSCYLPTNALYCDSRDLQVYSAQGYNVPVTVPLAPVCRTFNYGWGIPSSRLSQAGGYAAWYPDRPFSQSGGRLPGGIYPVIYHPTDTTQTGYFYNYVPTWQPRRW